MLKSMHACISVQLVALARDNIFNTVLYYMKVIVKKIYLFLTKNQ